MVVGAAILTVNLLRAHHLCGNAVGMVQLVLTVARLDVLGVDTQVFEVLTLVVEVLLEALQEGREEALGETADHVVSLDHKDRPGTLAQVADHLLAVLLERILLKIFLLAAKYTLRTQLGALKVAFLDFALGDQARVVLLFADLLGALALLRLLVRRRCFQNVVGKERIVGRAVRDETLRRRHVDTSFDADASRKSCSKDRLGRRLNGRDRSGAALVASGVAIVAVLFVSSFSGRHVLICG